MAGRPGELLAALLRPEPRQRPSGWALAVDAALAVATAIFAAFEATDSTGYLTVANAGARIGTWPVAAHPGLLLLVVVALTGLPLAARRLYPIPTLLTIVAAIYWLSFGHPHETLSVIGSAAQQRMVAHLVPHAALVGHNVPTPAIAFVTAVFASYSAVVHSRHRYLAVGVVVVVTLAVTVTFGDTLPHFPERLTALLAITPTVAVALGIRQLRQRLTDSTARLRRAAEEYEAATVRAVEAERARIAGELHDVVTHNVSVMVVQAGAARLAVASSPGEATDALRAVEASGRTAIAELRTLLGVLSPPDAEVALRPQPGLGELGELISRVSAAGLAVDLRVQGTPQPLPPGADLAAYRVVQEALTNVLRHAGRAATLVVLHWGEKLVITVSNTGGAGLRVGAEQPGRGLLGLQERLSLYGGELDAGPQPGGGWQVRAVMPVGAAA